MIFTSSLFILVFLPLFLILYNVVNDNAKNFVALIGSLIFYAWGAPKFIFVLLTILVLNFFIVKEMHQNKHKNKKKILLFLSLIINLGVLAYCKYSNFFVENLNLILESFSVSSIHWVKIALPIGISFFTFQSVTYTLDIYWAKHRPLQKVQDYLLYILLFPQLIAGPIIRFNTIVDEIEDRKANDTLDYKLEGIYLFVLGLAKKVLIANQVGDVVDQIFSFNDHLSFAYAWLAIIGYSVQIYFDFSGYSDMAIGLGKLMGFNFPENFNNPYSSKSITEFWRRWHMTLGSFMKDYLYIPLGGNQTNSKFRNYFNLVIVFLLSGLWHGASWNFVIWGLWHGVFLIIERLFLKDFLKKIPSIFGLLYTYLVVLIGWVFFRTETFAFGFRFVSDMFSNHEMITSIALSKKFLLFTVIGLCFSFLSTFKGGQKIQDYFYKNKYSENEHIYLSIAMLTLFVFSLSYIFASSFNPFIYFRF